MREGKVPRAGAVHAENANASSQRVSVCGFSNVTTTRIDLPGSVSCGYCLAEIHSLQKWRHTPFGWTQKAEEPEVRNLTTAELIEQLKEVDPEGTAKVFLYRQDLNYGVEVIKSEDGNVYLAEP